MIFYSTSVTLNCIFHLSNLKKTATILSTADRKFGGVATCSVREQQVRNTWAEADTSTTS